MPGHRGQGGPDDYPVSYLRSDLPAHEDDGKRCSRRTLEYVERGNDQAGLPPKDAVDVGGTGIARAVVADVAVVDVLAHDDGERDGAEQERPTQGDDGSDGGLH